MHQVQSFQNLNRSHSFFFNYEAKKYTMSSGAHVQSFVCYLECVKVKHYPVILKMIRFLLMYKLLDMHVVAIASLITDTHAHSYTLTYRMTTVCMRRGIFLDL